MTRPNFFIVGAPKCGTTAWHSYLASHPDIAFARQKEPHFFNTDMPGYRWCTDEDSYLSLFSHVEAQPVVGEASVMYLASRMAAANIATFEPDARILAFVREPVAFLRSYHNQVVLNLDESLSDFAEAWRASLDIARRKLPKDCRDRRVLDYKNVAAFGDGLQRFRDHFPPERIKVVRFEDWTSDPRATYLDILAFLGLQDDGRTEFPRVHEARHTASTTVARLTQRTPKPLLSLAGVLRKILGWERLGAAGAIRRLNTRKGYAAGRDGADDLAEIRAAFVEDQARLDDLLVEIAVSHAKAIRTLR